MNERTVDDVLVEFGLARHTRYRCPSETECGHVWPCPTRRLAAALAAVAERADRAEASLDEYCQKVASVLPDAQRWRAYCAVATLREVTPGRYWLEGPIVETGTATATPDEYTDALVREQERVGSGANVSEAPAVTGRTRAWEREGSATTHPAIADSQPTASPPALRCNPHPQEHGGE